MVTSLGMLTAMAGGLWFPPEGGTVVHAAPPIFVLAEELGYFPVRNNAGTLVYVPQHVQRTSTDQAGALAQFLRQRNVVMAGTYWCPHCRRQRELFGAAAWNAVPYVECAAAGYQGQPQYCRDLKVDGYPSWIQLSSSSSPGGGKVLLAGEHSLAELAAAVGYPGPWDETLEETSNPPPLVGAASSCQQ